MRKKSGGVLHLAEVIDEDLQERDIGLSKPQRRGIVDPFVKTENEPKDVCI